jgi:hypothetical protein
MIGPDGFEMPGKDFLPGPAGFFGIADPCENSPVLFEL